MWRGDGGHSGGEKGVNNGDDERMYRAGIARGRTEWGIRGWSRWSVLRVQYLVS